MFKKIAEIHEGLVQDFVYGTIGIWLLIIGSLLNLLALLISL